jgi:hypothetical protein
LLRAAERRSAAERPDAEPEPAFTRVWTTIGQVPDVRGLPLRAAISVLADRGCQTSVRGSGFVVEQSPAPATPLTAAMSCTIELDPQVHLAEGTAESRSTH